MNLPRHAELWLLPYLKDRLQRVAHPPPKPKRAWFVLADHFEPMVGYVPHYVELYRLAQWRDKWPRIADCAPKDSAGQRPQHSFFYPQEFYQHNAVEGIAEMVRLGVGDVEVHLHHTQETRERFINKINEYCHRLTNDHGLLHQENGRTVFGFIHGNWALDNCLPNGQFCGLDGEIRLLHELGCYADFTMPALPSLAQASIVNQIYWCTHNPYSRMRNFDRGIKAKVREGVRGDLLMITGPVGLRSRRKILPRLETGEIAGYDMPTPARVRGWFDLAPSIGNDLFIKLFTHGADDRNCAPLLNGGLHNLYTWLKEEADKRGIEIHWCTAWQMYQRISTLISKPKPMECASCQTATSATQRISPDSSLATTSSQTQQPSAL